MSSLFDSPKFAYFFLRIGLAAVFLWFGIDKFVHPEYWQTAWTPHNFSVLVEKFGYVRLIYAAGVFEILTGLSLMTSIFTKFFSFLAFLYLVAILLLNGLSEITIRDIGLIGGFLSIIFWSNFRSRF